jgi:hypothetical protein
MSGGGAAAGGMLGDEGRGRASNRNVRSYKFAIVDGKIAEFVGLSEILLISLSRRTFLPRLLKKPGSKHT